ncbi:hypothetical protein BKA93DRAFT_812265 [Sparassis latifolia]
MNIPQDIIPRCVSRMGFTAEPSTHNLPARPLSTIFFGDPCDESMLEEDISDELKSGSLPFMIPFNESDSEDSGHHFDTVDLGNVSLSSESTFTTSPPATSSLLMPNTPLPHQPRLLVTSIPPHVPCGPFNEPWTEDDEATVNFAELSLSSRVRIARTPHEPEENKDAGAIAADAADDTTSVAEDPMLTYHGPSDTAIQWLVHFWRSRRDFWREREWLENTRDAYGGIADEDEFGVPVPPQTPKRPPPSPVLSTVPLPDPQAPALVPAPTPTPPTPHPAATPCTYPRQGSLAALHDPSAHTFDAAAHAVPLHMLRTAEVRWFLHERDECLREEQRREAKMREEKMREERHRRLRATGSRPSSCSSSESSSSSRGSSSRRLSHSRPAQPRYSISRRIDRAVAAEVLARPRFCGPDDEVDDGYIGEDDADSPYAYASRWTAVEKLKTTAVRVVGY